jgi:hypothetical protein
MSDIFINYRRRDARGYALSLRDRLAARFGADQVFMDVSAIDGGELFEGVIASQLETARVQLVLIGPDWLTIGDSQGPRLARDGDLVRTEIARGLQRDIRVVPVVLPGAELPAKAELPADVQELVRRNAFRLHDDSWDADIARLIRSIEQALGVSVPDPGGLRWAVRAIRYGIRLVRFYLFVMATVVVLFGAYYAHQEGVQPWLIFLVTGTAWGLWTWLPFRRVGASGGRNALGLGLAVGGWVMAWSLVPQAPWMLQPAPIPRTLFAIGVALVGPIGTVVALRRLPDIPEAVRREFLWLPIIWGLTVGTLSVVGAFSDPGVWSPDDPWLELMFTFQGAFILVSVFIAILLKQWRLGRDVRSILRRWQRTIASWE